MRPDAARKIYYSLLAAFTAWGIVGVNSASAMQLFQVLGVSAGLVFALSAVQLLLVNTRLLPKELRPRWWRRAALLVCAVFYVTLFVLSGILGRG
jgi:multisubunit Na+/H+ antiporter MnhB subunit